MKILFSSTNSIESRCGNSCKDQSHFCPAEYAQMRSLIKLTMCKKVQLSRCGWIGQWKKNRNHLREITFNHCLSKFQRWSLIIVITKNIRTIDCIFIVILTTFRSICPSAFFRCFMTNSRVHTEPRTEPLFF